ncbi:MAG: MBL fold metallo-hydrolase [Halobacteriota archaeon]
MHLETVKAKGLAHHSYFLSDHGEAIVIDPRRDCAVYTEFGIQKCAQIKYIFESHCNEDLIVGSLDLQRQTGAEIGHSKETRFRYGDHNLTDNETFYVGDLKVEVLSTPGHTNDSLCFVVFERSDSNTPLCVFTGDTLLAGDVGRTDLLGMETIALQSKKLYRSIFERILPLGDHLDIYPAHGAGSVCGHNMSTRDASVLGYERQMNPLLQLDEERFVRSLTSQHLSVPPYFRRMRQLNLEGAPTVPHAVREVNVNDFDGLVKVGTTVIDTREPGAFASSHVPGSLNIWLHGMSFFPGWVLNDDEPVALVTERPLDVEVARTYLSRLGFDDVKAHLCGGIPEWRNRGKPTARLKTCSVDQLKHALDRAAVRVLDVRDEPEWREGHIKGAEHMFVGHLKQRFADIPRDKPLAIHCAWGGRASLAASILLRLGLANTYIVLGAIKAWKSRGYPLECGQGE